MLQWTEWHKQKVAEYNAQRPEFPVMRVEVGVGILVAEFQPGDGTRYGFIITAPLSLHGAFGGTPNDLMLMYYTGNGWLAMAVSEGPQRWFIQEKMKVSAYSAVVIERFLSFLNGKDIGPFPAPDFGREEEN